MEGLWTGARRSLLLAACLGAAACSGGAGGKGGTGAPAAPSGVQAQPGPARITLSWSEVPGATGYRIYWSLEPGVSPATAAVIPGAQSPHVHLGLTPWQAYHYRVAAVNASGEGTLSAEVSATPGPASSGAYDPPWAGVTPAKVLSLDHDSQLTDVQNGALLKQAIQGLTPGQRLEIGTGTFSVNSYFSIVLQGTAAAPIWIAPQPGATPVITRPDAGQNTVNVGSGGPTRYLCMQGLEITGGDTAMRLYDCQNVWVDGCNIHHCGGCGITANTADTAWLYLTRNHIHHTSGYGEGMYLGANNSLWIMRDSVVALNHVHDCGGHQGDGIELKQGSYGNWIVENLVHDTNYPCILVYGTDGNPFNLIERNVCYGSNDNVMQVQGEAVVRNNLILSGVRGFSSHDHQGEVRDLTFIHNTIVNSGLGATLSSWSGRPGMVFANNAVYSQNLESIRFSGGSSGVEVVGNVVLGPVTGTSAGFFQGNGLSDFVDLAWDATRRDATPAASGAIIGSGDLIWEVLDDLTGARRNWPLESGCLDGP